MDLMKKYIFSLLFIGVSLFASVDYSSASTEELLAMMGYVPTKNIQAFRQELNQRLSTMSIKEKKIYKQNIKKMKR